MYFLRLKVTARSHSHCAAVGTSTQKTTGDSAPPSRQTSSAEQPAPRIVRFCLVLSRSVSSCPATCARRTATAARTPTRCSIFLYFALLYSIFLYFSLFILIAIVRISLILYVLLLLLLYYYLLLLLLCYYYIITLLCYYYIIIIYYYCIICTIYTLFVLLRCVYY